MAVDTNTLELIRKTIFGGPQGGVLDFNAAFNPASAAASRNFNDMMTALVGGDASSNGTADNATGMNATSNAVTGATIGAIGQAVMGMVGIPGLSTAINAVTGLPSLASQLSAIAQGVANPNGIAVNNSGLTPQQIEAIAAGDSSDSAPDSGVNGDTAPGDASAGNAPDAGGAQGGGDGGGGDFFTGGFVPGPSTGQDKVNINVDGGEVVIPKHIVDMLGHNFFEDLLLNTKSPAQEYAEKQAALAAKTASKGGK